MNVVACERMFTLKATSVSLKVYFIFVEKPQCKFISFCRAEQLHPSLNKWILSSLKRTLDCCHIPMIDQSTTVTQQFSYEYQTYNYQFTNQLVDQQRTNQSITRDSIDYSDYFDHIFEAKCLLVQYDCELNILYSSGLLV